MVPSDMLSTRRELPKLEHGSVIGDFWNTHRSLHLLMYINWQVVNYHAKAQQPDSNLVTLETSSSVDLIASMTDYDYLT